jgi:hypothetical protein
MAKHNAQRAPRPIKVAGIPPRPAPVRIDFHGISDLPNELKRLTNWLVWKWWWDQAANQGAGKWDKPPVDYATGIDIDATDPANWMTFIESVERGQSYDGSGFALGPESNPCGLVGIDIDHCVDAAGNISPEAMELVRRFNSYAERTPTDGIRIWLRAVKPGGRCKTPSHTDPFLATIEVYSHSRYLTVTGRKLADAPAAIATRQTELDELYGEMFSADANHQGNGHPRAAGVVDVSDEELLSKARKAKSGHIFTALFDDGDLSRNGNDESSADQSLANRLAFWTGCDFDRMEHLFSVSALGKRKKWCNRPDYRARTIDKAIRDCTATYEPRPSRQAKAGAKLSSNGKHREIFTNFRKEKNDKGEEVKHSLSMPELIGKLVTQSGNWPKRVAEKLFVQTQDHTPVFLESPTQLIGWLDGIASVCWADGSSMITQARFYEYVRKFSAQRFDAIETLPHHPLMPKTYYMHPAVQPKTGGKLLDRFLDFFSPASDVDRILIRAAILTLFWGGPPGQRPAFRIDGPEDDTLGVGRQGTGKSTLVEVFAELVDGYVDLEEGEDINDLKTRLISTEEGRKRILRIDNLKQLSLSWSALEKFITTPVISGHAMYRGEGQRPNTITVFITINSGSFSKDMAQRAIQIRLARPAYSADWKGSVTKFIQDHRWELIGEIIGELADDKASVKAQSRWALWERDVLGQCSDFANCQKEIAKRIEAMDDDDADVFEIEEFFSKRLLDRKVNPATQNIKIPSAELADWYSAYTKRPTSPNRATTILQSKPLTKLRYKRTNSERYWIWTGDPKGPNEQPVDLPPY